MDILPTGSPGAHEAERKLAHLLRLFVVFESVRIPPPPRPGPLREPEAQEAASA